MSLVRDLRKALGIKKETMTNALSSFVKAYFNFKKHFYYCKNINFPKEQSIFALWHAHQCGMQAIENKEKLNAMISRSQDGNIIAAAAESLGYKTVRGSNSRGGVSAALEMLDRLKAGGNGAITIDGPRGPKEIVKKGIIEIARISGVPIVPMTWHSPSWGFLKLGTWDEFRFPLCCIKMIAIYGEPMHIKEDATDEEVEEYRQRLQDELNVLYARAQKDFKELRKS